MLKKEIMQSQVQPPQYLYKVISFRNWQAAQTRKVVVLSAEDDVFIHLATEEQLDRIIAKFWSDNPKFVVLKLDTSKLTGELLYETNPGGTTKYFHLYKGVIRLNAIVEAKIIFRQHSDEDNQLKLEIVQVGDPVLRKPARELTVEEIKSSEIQNLIEQMKAAMRAAPGVGLAAPQVGRGIQLIVIEDVDHANLTPAQLIERDRYKVPFHVVINPRLYTGEGGKAEFFEGCLSVPQFLGVVPRAKSVRVECLNERAELVEIHATGWYARILQHEVDHLNATLFIDRALQPTLMTEENYMKLWKGKSIAEICSELN